MAQKTDSKLAIKIDTKQGSNTYKFQSQSIKFPFSLPCEINNFQLFLNQNGSDPISQNLDQGTKYSGGISGDFAVPAKNFQKHFYFNIPFSIKYSTGIALSFSTNDFTNDKLSLLNQFVFGQQQIKPIVITKEVAVQIATFLIKSSSGFDLLKSWWEKAIKFIQKNNISINLLLDHLSKRYQVGFFWEEFKLDGMPEEISIKDVMFGVSLDLNPAHQNNKYAVKIGGKGSFKAQGKSGAINQSNLFIEYSLNSLEQRLEFAGTVSLLTTLLDQLGVKIPSQLEDFAKNTTLSIEWVSDPKKKITAEMKK